MAACQEIKDIGNVEDELRRLRELMRLIYASITSNDYALSEIASGLLWFVGDIETDLERLIAGIEKIEEAAGRVPADLSRLRS